MCFISLPCASFFELSSFRVFGSENISIIKFKIKPQEKEGESSCTKCPEKMTTVTEGSISSLDCHYTSCEPGSKVVIVNSRVTCEACSTGFYQNAANVTFCHICPKNSYQDMQVIWGKYNLYKHLFNCYKRFSRH